MKDMIYNLYTGAKGIKIGLCAFVFAIYVRLVVYGGGSISEMISVWSYLICCVYVPGCCLNRLTKADRQFTDISIGINILLGTGFFCAVYCFAMRLHIKWLLLILPMALTIIYLILSRKDEEKKVLVSPDQWLLILLFFALLLLYTFSGVVKNALPSKVGDTLLNPDILWNIGNANSFTLRFIPEDIRYSGVQLHYHYLTELFAGALSWITNISAYNIIAFYLQPAVLIGVIVCLYSFGKSYFQNEKKALFFTFSMFLFGCVSMWNTFLTGRSPLWNDNAYHIITNVNAQATAVIFLSIFSAMFIQLLDKGFKPNFMQFCLWIASFFMLSFAKGPVAAIVAIGAVITVLWMFVQKKTNIKGVLCVAVMGGLFYVIYSIFFASGANTSMAFNIWGTLSKTAFDPFLDSLLGNKILWYFAHFVVMALMVVLVSPLQGFLYYIGLGKDIKNLFKLSGKRLWINSVIAGGFLAYFLFDHYAMSQVYFLFLALFFMHLFAVDTLWSLKSKTVKNIAIALGCVAFITNAFIYTNLIGSGARFLARNLGIIEKYPYSVVVNADDQLAMEFLKNNSEENALFATNRIHANLATKNGVSNIYSAFSSRQCYMEGYAYALTNMGVPYFVVEQRKEINSALFSPETDADELKNLCEKTGITHLVYSSQFEGSDELISEVFDKIYDSETVRIYATGVKPLANHPLYQEELSQYGEKPEL